ncbi:MAG: SdrD B-like domain-containing protein [Patescibacteria group bacterium]
MENGDFKYDIELPKKEGVDNATVQYIEKSLEDVKGKNLSDSDVKEVDEKDLDIKESSIEATDLDHFTIFVVVANQTLSDSGVSNEDNGWVSDNNYAVFNDDSDSAVYSFPDISIPAGHVIDGIEVLVEGKNSSSRDFNVSLWNVTGNPDAYTSLKFADLTGTESTLTLGSPSDLWGKNWGTLDFTDATFKVKVEADHDSGEAFLDHISVKVYTSSKDLSVVKTNNVNGQVTVNNSFNWVLTVTNNGPDVVTFNEGWDILEDGLPSSGVTYLPTSNLPVNTSGGVVGTIDCDIISSILDCDAFGGAVTIPSGGSFNVTVSATPTNTGTLVNPKSGKICKVDPDHKIAESNENNNFCADTITVNEIQHVPVTFCHATPPDTAANGYNEIITDDDGVLSGHGPQHSADIIPPFDYYGGHFPGRNWDPEHEAILRNHCVPTGSIQVVKVVDDGSDKSQWSFALDNGTPVQANPNGVVLFENVTPGQHTVTESGPGTHSVTSVTGCTLIPNTTTATADVAIGQPTVCTFTNSVHRGSITIIKDAHPEGAQDFPFVFETNQDFTLDDDADSAFSNTKTFSNLLPNLPPSHYRVTEGDVAGWALTSISCESSLVSINPSVHESTVSLDLHAGENITCTFVNTKEEFCGDGIVNGDDEACDYSSLNGSSTCSQSCEWKEAVCSEEPVNVTNGEFETPDVTNGAGWDIFDSSQVPGWTAEWVDGPAQGRPEPKIEIHGGVNGWTGNNDQYVELDSDWGGPSSPQNGEPASISIYQDIPTIVGDEYTVSFDYAARPDHGNNRMEVKVDSDVAFDTGVISDGNGGSVDWINHTITFTATDDLTRLRFTELGTSNSLGMFLDNVRISCEEPVRTSDVKICKLNQGQQGLPDWNVFLKGTKVGDVNVLPNGNTYSSAVLSEGDYIVEANGTYTYRPGDPLASDSDANFSKRLPSDPVYVAGPSAPWVNVNTFPNPYTGWLGVMTNGSATDWGYYNSGHQYVLGYPNYTGDFDFKILDDNYSDNSGSIPLSIYNGYAGVTGEDGCVTFEDVALGSYTLDEILKDEWENIYGKGDTVEVDGATETFYIGNKETPKPAKIAASKVVCDNETYLPNMSGGANISATTATDWVAQSQGHCQLVEDWEFQWATSGGTFGSFQTDTSSLGSPWATFSGTTSLPLETLGQKVEVREVFPDDSYVPFSNAGDVSAEIYCADDVANYDNWEWIQNLQEDTTYYCVAFNALNKPDVQITKTDSPDPVTSGGILTYTLSIKNNGPSVAENVVVTDSLPAQFQLQSVTPSAGTCSDFTGPDIQCEFGNLNVNDTRTIEVKGIALGTGVIVNTASVSTTNGDINLSNNTDTEDTTINEVPGVCLSNTTYANSVIAFSQGKRKNGSSVLATRSIPSAVLGVPNATTNPDNGFVSLGQGGSVTVKFTNPVVDVVGVDLSFHEVTNGRNSYPLETAKVEVSTDGSVWQTLPGVATSEPGGDGTVYLDFSSTGLPSVQYVRITDTTNFTLNGDSLSDGYDIDAIDAKCGSGTVVVKKETAPDASEQSFSFDPSWSGDNFSLSDGDEASFNLLSGNYSVAEALPLPEGWDQASVSCVSSTQNQESANALSLQPGETITCTFTNAKEIKVVASKIVCTDEADLPNWGTGPSNNITQITAQRWVNAHPGCELVDWEFQWSENGAGNPGDNTGAAVAGWNTFATGDNGTAEVVIPGYGHTSRLWFREVWNDQYIPFTYGEHSDNSNNVSAEFYCNNDVLNYDNWDWIDTTPGGTYYCVAWNALNRGSISGSKWNDENGDGQWDEEPIVEGWQITLSGNEQELQTTTDKNGQYTFGDLLPGEYTICEVGQEGWIQTYPNGDSQCHDITITPGEDEKGVDFGNFQLGKISGNKWNDINGNGENEEEADLSGWQIVLGKKTLVNSVNVPADSVNPVDLGTFVSGNTYVVEAEGTYEAGDFITADAECSIRLAPVWSTFVSNYEYLGEGLLDLRLDNNATTEWSACNTVNHTYHKVVAGDDANHAVSLYDTFPSNNTGSLTVNVYQLVDVQTDITDEEDGAYSFEDLTAGEYLVCEVQQEGWLQTAPLPGCHTVTVTSGADEIAQFANFELGSITVQKYADDDHSFGQNDEEANLAGWTFYLDLNGNQQKDGNEPFGETGENGTYTFTGLPAGHYNVEEVQQEGWELTENSCGPQDNREERVQSLVLVDEVNGGVTVTSGSESTCVFGNFTDPNLEIQKFNDSFPTTELPNNIVQYTIKVKATDNDVLDVEVTDLPPAGFVYEPGSASATSDDPSHTGMNLSHEYASPGIWSLGDMKAGETITLTYNTKISDAQDEGIYDDLAYARGTSESNNAVLADDVADADNFAGTRVAVAVPVADPVVGIDTDNKTESDTKRKTQYVLGAALPMTGANSWFLMGALVLLVLGMGLLFWDKRRKMKILVLALAFVGVFSGQQALAASSLAVDIEEPDAVVTSPGLQIGFVALDIEGRSMSVDCYKVGDALPFQSVPLIDGGSSGNCQVNNNVMTADGDYQFYVVATATGEGSESLSSDTVNVKLVSTVPGTPYNYERDQSTCDDRITFTTANDGDKTNKIELYRSTQKDFVAETPVATLTIGSNQSGQIVVTPPDCNEDYWYAIRAIDQYGNGSGFVGDEDVDVHTKTKNKTTTVTLPGEQTGALAVAEAGAVAGEGVAGAETEAGAETAPSEEGSVLGEATSSEEGVLGNTTEWTKKHPWATVLGIIILILLASYGYRRYTQIKRG